MFKQVLFFLLNTVLSILMFKFSHISKLFGKACLNNPFLLTSIYDQIFVRNISQFPSISLQEIILQPKISVHKFIHFHKNILRYVTQVLQPCKLSVNVEIMIFFNSLLKKIIFSSHRTKERSGQRHHFRYIWRLSEGLAFSCQGIDIFATINNKTLDL